MKRIKWSIWLLLGLILLLLIGLGIVYGKVRGGWPQVNGKVLLDGLESPVEVVRDKMGVPHIYAENSHDLFMAQGYVHAQDRFWQMEFWRRIGSGRLSEILGESALGDDRFIRTLGWRRVAEAELELLDDETQAALEAYAQGVNAYLEQEKDRGLEFTVLGLTGVQVEPEPWQPADTLTWAKVMSWDLGGNMGSELTRARWLALLGSELLQDRDPAYPADRPVIVPSELSWRPEQAEVLAQLMQAADLELAFGRGPGLGSNNWVVSGEKSQTGQPILVNDPHLGIQMPSIWYEVGLHCGDNCPYNVVGFSFAGMPGVIVGHNQRIAWGVTNTGPDVQDLYVEKLNPQSPDQYEYQGEWQEMEIRHETIKVSGWDEPLVIRVRSTQHGPIVNDVLDGAGTGEWVYGWQPLALQWTALQPGTLANAVLSIDRAQNWEEFRQALQLWDAPAQNFVFADVEGNIGYQMPGRIPIRAQGDGSLPVPGWTGEYEWVDTIPFEELPRLFNPPQGFIVTANNAVVDSDYPYFISREWASGYRAQRIVDLLTAKDKLSLEDMGQIQMDSYNYSASEQLPYLLDLSPADVEVREMLAQLENWDLQMRRDSNPAVLYSAFWVFLMEDLFADELGERPGGNSWDQLVVRSLLEQPDNLWWDDQQTLNQVETRDEILEMALANGLSWLQDTLGGNMEDWTYGQLHTATFENQSLGQSGIGLVESVFNRGPFPTDGGPAIVNATSWSATDPAVVRGVPSMRQIIDMSNFENSISVHTTGQSGHPYHRHYDDMIPMWQDGLFHAMHWERAAVEADAEGTLQMEP